ncbi:MAG: DUF3545 family protein [Glaciecola sp.]
MESVDFLNTVEVESRGVKTKSKKRKWREIEAIKDRYRLKQELSDMDVSWELELEHAR